MTPALSVAAIGAGNPVGNPDAASGLVNGGAAEPIECQYAFAGVRTLAEPVPPIPSTPVYERSHSDVTGTAGDGRKCVPPAREPDRSTEGSNKDHGGGVESSIIGGAGPAVLKDVNES